MAVFRALERLDLVVPDEETYLEVIRGEGLVTPWSELWERYFTYELAPREGGGFAPRTNKAACLEDAGDIGATDWPALWPAITMPATLIRATVPLGGGDVVPLEVRDGIQAAVPQLELVEVERNHYGVMEHPEAIAAML
jgi:hypothetical protein